MARPRRPYEPHEETENATEPHGITEISLCIPDEDYDFDYDREIEIYEETLSEFAGE